MNDNSTNENRRTIPSSLLEEIKDHVRYAITASDKKSAEPYIEKLRFKSRDFKPPASDIFGYLIGEVVAASGRVKNKEHWISCAERSISKLKRYVEELG
jgi:hypothetical protein